MYVYILSIDPGEKNLALFIERYPKDMLDKLKFTGTKYDKNGEATTEFKIVLNKIYKLGERIWHEKKDLTTKDDKKIGKRRKITNTFLNRMTVYLEELNKQGLFNNISYVIIEQQQRKATNNLEIQYHIRAYFIGLFSIFVPIICFPAKNKTRVLGCPKEVFDTKKNIIVKTTNSKPHRKIWSSMRGLDILSLRGDVKGIETIFGKKCKTDDISDCLIQSIAFVILLFLDKQEDLLE